MNAGSLDVSQSLSFVTHSPVKDARFNLRSRPGGALYQDKTPSIGPST